MEKRLRALAAAELPERCRELAEQAGVKVARACPCGISDRAGARAHRAV